MPIGSSRSGTRPAAGCYRPAVAIRGRSLPRRVDGVDLAKLPLSPSEAFVLSQLDDASDLDELSAVTNLGEGELDRALEHLATLGAITRVGRAAVAGRPDPRREDDEPPTTDRVVPSVRAPRAAVSARSLPPKKAPTIRAATPAARASARGRPPRDLAAPEPEARTPDRTKATTRAVATKTSGRSKGPTTSRSGASARSAPRRAMTPPPGPTPKTSVPVREAPPQTETSRSRKGASGSRRAAVPSKRSTPAASARVASPPTASVRVPPPLAEPDLGDLSAEARQAIDDLCARLQTDTHYRVFGVEPDAPLKQIRNAYFQLVMAFAPDKDLGQRLGVYKTRLDALRTRLAELNELLSNATRRQDYDAYLATQAATRALEAKLSEPALDAPFPPSGPRVAELRRILQSGRNPPAPRPTEPYRATAERAIADGQWVSAVNAAKMALSLTPDDPALQALLDTASAKAAGELAERYATRAAYEEDKLDWEAAARSWERVAEGKPTDATPFARAAECALRAGTDVRGAVRLARGAVARAPNEASHHLLLARANEAAGLVESALGELSRALELTPKDATIAPWIARLRKARG